MGKFYWIVVANGSQAKILEKPHAEAADWKEVERLIYPDIRIHGSKLDGDARGHTISGRRGLAPRQELKEYHHHKFSKLITEKLRDGALSSRINKITIFASAPILGELLKQTEDSTKKLIDQTYAIDLTALPIHDLNKRFHEEFAGK